MLKPGNEPVDLSVDILSSIIFPISDFSWEEFRHMSHRRIGIDTADSLLRPRGIYAYKMQSSNTTPAGTIRRKTYCNLRIWTRIHRCICTAIGTPAGIEGQDLTLPVLLTDIHCSSYIGQNAYPGTPWDWLKTNVRPLPRKSRSDDLAGVLYICQFTMSSSR